MGLLTPHDRYYVDSYLPQDGICLADVPGSKDINMYRVTAANEYLQQCEMTVVVVDIKRATSNQLFRQHYLDAHSRRHNGSVILMATRSDVSTQSTLKSDFADHFPQELNDDGGSSLQLDTTAEEQLIPVEEKMNALTGELQSIEHDLEANKLEIKRIKNKSQLGNASEDVRSKADVLRQANKISLVRKKEITPIIASLEKE
jgi:hypothetical protein